MDKHPRFDSLLEDLKLLVLDDKGNPNYATVLGFTLKKTIQDVANYCNIPASELPEELDLTILSMCDDLIKSGNLLAGEDGSGNVASLSEGDASVTFKSPAEVLQELHAANPISYSYAAILNNFRRLQL